jgi:hypothetical protein
LDLIQRTKDAVRELDNLQYKRLKKILMAGVIDEENRPNGRSDLAEDDSSQVCLYMNKYELLPSLGVRRLSSVNFSHFNLLL